MSGKKFEKPEKKDPEIAKDFFNSKGSTFLLSEKGLGLFWTLGVFEGSLYFGRKCMMENVGKEVVLQHFLVTDLVGNIMVEVVGISFWVTDKVGRNFHMMDCVGKRRMMLLE